MTNMTSKDEKILMHINEIVKLINTDTDERKENITVKEDEINNKKEDNRTRIDGTSKNIRGVFTPYEPGQPIPEEAFNRMEVLRNTYESLIAEEKEISVEEADFIKNVKTPQLEEIGINDEELSCVIQFKKTFEEIADRKRKGIVKVEEKNSNISSFQPNVEPFIKPVEEPIVEPVVEDNVPVPNIVLEAPEVNETDEFVKQIAA